MDKIYSLCPIPVQQVIVGIYGNWWFQRRFSDHFHRLVREYKERESWSGEQFRNYQQMQFTRIVRAAWQSRYYREVFHKYRLAQEMDSLEMLPFFPLLAKDTLRTRPRDLITRDPLPAGTMIQKTSGTTGTPTHIYYTREFHATELAVPEARNLNWAGVDYRNRRVMFGVRKVCNYSQNHPPFWRFSPKENMAYTSIYHLSPKFIPAYLEFLRSYRPSVIMGYPSALATLARYAVDHHDYPAPAKAIFTMSETLGERARAVIENAWKARIYDRYGAVEGCAFASQCEYGHYHVSPEVGIIEILDHDGKACPPGVMGEVVCTGLQNDLQPLIRYRIGDVARWSEDQDCPCKRKMPVIEGIEGRVEDICRTRDGREMLRFDTVFKGVDTIRQAQVVQKSLDQFIVYVVPGDGYSALDAERICHNMKDHVGDAAINVEVMESIPRSASGKFRAVICKLPHDQSCHYGKSDAV